MNPAIAISRINMTSRSALLFGVIAALTCNGAAALPNVSTSAPPSTAINVGGDFSAVGVDGPSWTVYYGIAGKKWFTLTGSGQSPLHCNPGTFGGDPAPGVAKRCYVVPNTTRIVQPCATDFQKCSYPGPGTVIYGLYGRMARPHPVTAAGSLACQPSTLGGDPAPNVQKNCFFFPAAAPVMTTTLRPVTTTTARPVTTTTTTTVKSTTTTTKAVAAAAGACSLAKPKLISALSKPVQDLLAQKLTDDITPTSDVNLAIHAIAYYGDTATLTVLLDACANPNFVDGGGITPLFMVYGGEDGSGDGKNFEATVKLLLQRGANVNFKTKGGMTPLKQLDQTAALFKKEVKIAASIAVSRKILTDGGAK